MTLAMRGLLGWVGGWVGGCVGGCVGGWDAAGEGDRGEEAVGWGTEDGVRELGIDSGGTGWKLMDTAGDNVISAT